MKKNTNFAPEKYKMAEWPPEQGERFLSIGVATKQNAIDK
jgi:hypothetical protein